MVFYLKGDKVVTYSYFGGSLCDNIIKIYKRSTRFRVFKYWRLIDKFSCVSSPSYINWYKEELTKYYDEDFDTLLKNTKKIKSRKKKIKKLLE